jgi:RimJ/RimL family protein N-acetyltransferase
MTSAGLARVWPAAGVRARAGDLELRWIDDDVLLALGAVAAQGVHGDDPMPFYVPWTRGTPEEVARAVTTYHWSIRPKVSPKHVTLELAALVDGRVVGSQGASGDDWAVLRRAETGSWLGREFQGRGIGTRMRVLMLHVLFEGLGAEAVTSSAFADNAASNAVSRKVGYADNGVSAHARDGEPVGQQRYLMTRDRWTTLRAKHREILGEPVELEGLEALRAQLEPAG